MENRIQKPNWRLFTVVCLLWDPIGMLFHNSKGSAGPWGLGGGRGISLSDGLLKRSRVRGLAAACQPAIVKLLFPSNLTSSVMWAWEPAHPFVSRGVCKMFPTGVKLLPLGQDYVQVVASPQAASRPFGESNFNKKRQQKSVWPTLSAKCVWSIKTEQTQMCMQTTVVTTDCSKYCALLKVCD